jgi:zinc D-Ala-D-Ala carboxypeptidase
MTRSHTAARLWIVNKPSAEEIGNLELLCEKVLDPVRENFGIPFSPSSAFRNSKLNEAVGGSEYSQHLEGKAADIEIPTVSTLDLAVWMRDNLEFDQLVLESHDPVEPSSGWVHVSYNDNENRGECLSYVDGAYSRGIGGGGVDHFRSVSNPRRITLNGLIFIVRNFLRDMLSLRRNND